MFVAWQGIKVEALWADRVCRLTSQWNGRLRAAHSGAVHRRVRGQSQESIGRACSTCIWVLRMVCSLFSRALEGRRLVFAEVRACVLALRSSSIRALPVPGPMADPRSLLALAGVLLGSVKRGAGHSCVSKVLASKALSSGRACLLCPIAQPVLSPCRVRLRCRARDRSALNSRLASACEKPYKAQSSHRGFAMKPSNDNEPQTYP